MKQQKTADTTERDTGTPSPPPSETPNEFSEEKITELRADLMTCNQCGRNRYGTKQFSVCPGIVRLNKPCSPRPPRATIRCEEVAAKLWAALDEIVRLRADCQRLRNEQPLRGVFRWEP